MPDNRERIDLTARQVEALRQLSAATQAAQHQYTAYLSAILHGYDIPLDAAFAFDGQALVRQK